MPDNLFTIEIQQHLLYHNSEEYNLELFSMFRRDSLLGYLQNNIDNINTKNLSLKLK